jgi:hypothetical protein
MFEPLAEQRARQEVADRVARATQRRIASRARAGRRTHRVR